MIQSDIRELQKAQRWNARAIANMKPSGAYGKAMQVIVSQVQRYEVSITHVGRYFVNGGWRGGGTLRASERMEIHGLRGRVYLDPSARNPITQSRPAEYGVIENARGGEHAFGERTANDAAPRIVGAALAQLGRDLI
jgi:hypothetical protein